MRPARSALLGFFLVVAALLACKKQHAVQLATPSNQPVPPGDGGGTSSHKQINTDTYSVECYGTNLDCVKEAASVCQTGYDVLATSEGTPADAGAPPAPTPALAAADAAVPDAGAAPAASPTGDAGAVAVDAGVRIEMVVKCKK